jgi:hypothetical protein
MSANIPPTKYQFFIHAVCPRTEGEFCPLQLALLGVVCGLVLRSGCAGVCCGLLQQSVGAHRRRRRGVVEESNDILLSGLTKHNTISNDFF